MRDWGKRIINMYLLKEGGSGRKKSWKERHEEKEIRGKRDTEKRREGGNRNTERKREGKRETRKKGRKKRKI